MTFLFSAGAPLTCREAANPNDDDAINITDALAILNFLFGGESPPASPGPPDLPCGPDPVDSPQDLGCETYVPCAG